MNGHKVSVILFCIRIISSTIRLVWIRTLRWKW